MTWLKQFWHPLSPCAQSSRLSMTVRSLESRCQVRIKQNCFFFWHVENIHCILVWNHHQRKTPFSCFFLLMNSAIIRWEFLFLFFFKNGTFALERRFLPIKSPLLRLPAFPPISNLKDSLNEAKVVKLLKPTPLFTYMMDLNHVFLNNYAPFWIVANKSGAVWGSVIKELKPWGVAFHPVRTGSAPREDADTRVHTFGQIPPIFGSDIWSAVGDVPPLVIPGCDHSC